MVRISTNICYLDLNQNLNIRILDCSCTNKTIFLIGLIPEQTCNVNFRCNHSFLNYKANILPPHKKTVSNKKVYQKLSTR